MIGQRGRIRLGLAVSIDDNPRERSRGRRTSRIIKAVSFEKEMPGDTVTRLWSLHRGIITVVMARVDEKEEKEEEKEEGERQRAGEGESVQGEEGSYIMPRIRVYTIMSGDTARGQRARRGRSKEEKRLGEGEKENEREKDRCRLLPQDRILFAPDGRHAVPHPRIYAREPAHKSVYTHSRLIFNPLDSVNACGRPPTHDVDSRPRSRVIGIRLLESPASARLAVSLSLFLLLPSGMCIIAHVSVQTWITLPSVLSPAVIKATNDTPVVLGDALHKT